MRTVAASEPGSPTVASEDWHHAARYFTVVLDGATTRTGTGCVHGVPWYVHQLGMAIVTGLTRRPRHPHEALRGAISHVAGLHPECDLTHPGTPSAGVGIAIDTGVFLLWLVLGDVTVAVDMGRRVKIVVDDRVSATAATQRETADHYPIGHPGKATALLAMKEQELAARNRPGGYWIAAADPQAADHALIGTVSSWSRATVLTDGAGRATRDFGLMTWDTLIGVAGADPGNVIRAVRVAEAADPDGSAWPRNKASDDATVVHATPEPMWVLRVGDRVVSQWDTTIAGWVACDRYGQNHLRVRFDSSPVEVEMPATELYPAGMVAGDRS
jgi:hypothetical protein